MTSDPFDLKRFVSAQSGRWDEALAELRAGHKRGHWIWFILPQLRGLGHSEMAEQYGLEGLDEARAYLAHPLLGPRLRAAVSALLTHAGRSAEAILGEVDAMKFRSCATLFAQASDRDPLFVQALQQFYGGKPDRATLAMLG